MRVFKKKGENLRRGGGLEAKILVDFKNRSSKFKNPNPKFDVRILKNQILNLTEFNNRMRAKFSLYRESNLRNKF